MEQQRGIRKTKNGTVVSDKMDKTIVVEVKTKVRVGATSNCAK